MCTFVERVLPQQSFDDYVNVPDHPSLDLTDTLTLAAWVKPATSQEAYARIISRAQSGIGNRRYNLDIDQSADDPRTVVDTVDTDTVEVSADVTFTDDDWRYSSCSAASCSTSSCAFVAGSVTTSSRPRS